MQFAWLLIPKLYSFEFCITFDYITFVRNRRKSVVPTLLQMIQNKFCLRQGLVLVLNNVMFNLFAEDIQ